jgi:hypothetical protein
MLRLTIAALLMVLVVGCGGNGGPQQAEDSTAAPAEVDTLAADTTAVVE